MRCIEEIECGVCRRHIYSVVDQILDESSHPGPLGELPQQHILLSKGVVLIGVKDSNESRGGGYFEFRHVVDGEIVNKISKQGRGALVLLQTVWRTLKESELQSRNNPVQEIALGDLHRILSNYIPEGGVPRAMSSISFPPLDSVLKTENPMTSNNSTALSDVNSLTIFSSRNPKMLDLAVSCAAKERKVVDSQFHSLDLPEKNVNVETATTSDSSASAFSLAPMHPLDDTGISSAFTKLAVVGGGPGQGYVESDNELLLFKAEESLEKGYRKLLESFWALQCNATEFEKNGKLDFNPLFSKLHTTCEESIVALFQSITSMLHTLSLLASLGFLADGKDPAAEAQKWVSMAWCEYESCLSALFEIVVSAQEATPCSSGTFRPVFLSPDQQNQVLAVVKSKNDLLENLHSTICDILKTPHVRSLFIKLDHLHKQWDSVLHDETMSCMNDRVHLLLLMRVETMNSGIQLFMTEMDLLNSARAAENKLGVYISDWEKRLDKMKGDLLEHSSITLAAGVYSQGPAMRFNISESEKLFKEQWDQDNESREFKHTVTQSEVAEIVERIAQLNHRAVGLNKREQKEEKGYKKNIQQAALNGPNQSPSTLTQLMLEQERRRDETSRELEHTANEINLYKAYQSQFKVKFSLLIFLTSVLYRRFQCMHTFSAIVHARTLVRSAQEYLLCGSVKKGENRLATLAMSTLIEEVHDAVTRWYAKQAARQLIEDEEREGLRLSKREESEARRKAEKLNSNAPYKKEQRHQERNNKTASSGTEEAAMAASISTTTSFVDNHSTTCSSNSDAVEPPPYRHLDKKQMQSLSQCAAVRVDNEGWEVMEEENDHEGFINILPRFQKVKARKGEREQKEKERRDKDRRPHTTISSSIVKPPSSSAAPSLLSHERAGKGDSHCHGYQSSKEQPRGKRKAHITKQPPQPRNLNKEDRKGVRGGEQRDFAPSVNRGIEAGTTSLPSASTTAPAAEMVVHKELPPTANGILTSTAVNNVVHGDTVTTKYCISTENLSRGVSFIDKDEGGEIEPAAHTTSRSSDIVITAEERAVTPSGLETTTPKIQLPDASARLDPADVVLQQKMEVEMRGGGRVASSSNSCVLKTEVEKETRLGFNSGEDLPNGMCIQFGAVELSSEDLLMDTNSRNEGGREESPPVEEHVETEVGDREELDISSTKGDKKIKRANGVKLGNEEKEAGDRREELNSSSTAAKMGNVAKCSDKQNDEKDVIISGMLMPNTVAVDDVVVANEVKNAVGVGVPVPDTVVVQTSTRDPSSESTTDDKYTSTIVEEGASDVNQADKDDGSSHDLQQPIIVHGTSGVLPSNSPIVEGDVGTHSGSQHLNSSSQPQLVHPAMTAHPYPQQLQQPQYVMPAQYQSAHGVYNNYNVLHQSGVSNMSYYPVVGPQHMACPRVPYSEMQYELPEQGFLPQQGGEVGAPHYVYMDPGKMPHGGQQVWLCNGGPQFVLPPLAVPQRAQAVNQQRAAYMEQLQMGSNGYTLQPITTIEGGGYQVKQGGKNRKWKPRGRGNRGRGHRSNIRSKYG